MPSKYVNRNSINLRCNLKHIVAKRNVIERVKIDFFLFLLLVLQFCAYRLLAPFTKYIWCLHGNPLEEMRFAFLTTSINVWCSCVPYGLQWYPCMCGPVAVELFLLWHVCNFWTLNLFIFIPKYLHWSLFWLKSAFAVGRQIHTHTANTICDAVVVVVVSFSAINRWLFSKKSTY